MKESGFQSLQAGSSTALARKLRTDSDAGTHFVVQPVNLRSRIIASFTLLQEAQRPVGAVASAGVPREFTGGDAMCEEISIIARHCSLSTMRRTIGCVRVGFSFRNGEDRVTVTSTQPVVNATAK